jgi:predicted RNase H-like nuclease (RuvC/YqgF family)
VRPVALAVVLALLAGCASWAPPWRPTVALLERADDLVVRGDYAGAQRAYEDLLGRYPDDPSAPRARLMRDVIIALLAARTEVARLRGQLAEAEKMRAEVDRTRAEAERMRADLGRQRDELAAKQREELAARDGEVTRLKNELGKLGAEAERLRTDLENLKKIDLNLERQRR